MSEKKPVTMRYTLKVKRANVEFAEGMGIAVLATLDVEFQVTDEELKSVMFHSAILDYAQQLVDDVVEVEIEEVK